MKITKLILSTFLITIAFIGCSKWDDFKKYTNEGEKLYSGKIDSVKLWSGNLRVKLFGLLPADPKITRLKVTWNDGKDSALYNIAKTSKIDTINQFIDIGEGIYNFKFQTFDAAGNGSLISSATGISLGPKYEKGLINRPIANAEILGNGNAEIRWGDLDIGRGAKGSWIKFSKSNDLIDSLYIPMNESISIIPDFKSGSSISIRTVYRPTNSVDDFFASREIVNVRYDVTNSYVGNPGANFTSLQGGSDRWQTPSVWITTDDVRNGGDNKGGLDASPLLASRVLSIEASHGMSEVKNGKIYQSMLLPAGKYSFITSAGDCSSGGTKYLTVSSGTVPPDINEVPGNTLAYKLIDKNVDNKLMFSISKPTQICLAIQASMPAEGNFMKVVQIRLLYSAL
jgi:hypothetical protein